MIDPQHPGLPIARQCTLIGISRSAFYAPTKGESPINLALMRLIDAQFLETPWYGSRQMARHLRRQGHCVGRKRVRRLMAKMGLVPIYQKPRTTVPHPEHRKWPYLLRNLVIDRPDKVWCADITYIPMRRGFLYLVAIMERAIAAPSVRARWRVRAGGSWHGGCRTVRHGAAIGPGPMADGGRFLHRGAGGGYRPPWSAGDLQHGAWSRHWSERPCDVRAASSPRPASPTC